MSIVSLYAKFLHKSFLRHWPHKMLWLTQTVWCFKTNKSVWDCAKKERFQHFEYKFGVVIYWVFFWRKNYSILLSNQKKPIVQLFRVLIRCYITVPKLFLFTVMGNLFRPDLSQLCIHTYSVSGKSILNSKTFFFKKNSLMCVSLTERFHVLIVCFFFCIPVSWFNFYALLTLRSYWFYQIWHRVFTKI